MRSGLVEPDPSSSASSSSFPSHTSSKIIWPFSNKRWFPTLAGLPEKPSCKPQTRDLLSLRSHATPSIEAGGTLSEVMDAYHNVATWSKPERARWSLTFFAMKPTIRKESKGVVLIISPFNYPMLLSLGPLVRSH